MLAEGRRRILFVGGGLEVAAVRDRYQGYCDALEEAGANGHEPLAILRSGAEQVTLDSIRSLLSSPDRPDAVLAASFFRFFPVLKVLEELQL